MKNIVKVTIASMATLLTQITMGEGFAGRGQENRAELDPETLISVAERSGGRVFVFDPRRHSWYAYENGRLVASGRASGGAGYCPDIRRSCRTPSGSYRVISKGSANCRSTRYPRPHGGARMDYCMFFSRLYAVHGSNNVPNYNASHGCIRVLPAHARWLHGNFMSIGTRVIVRSY